MRPFLFQSPKEISTGGDIGCWQPELRIPYLFQSPKEISTGGDAGTVAQQRHGSLGSFNLQRRLALVETTFATTKPDDYKGFNLQRRLALVETVLLPRDGMGTLAVSISKGD